MSHVTKNQASKKLGRNAIKLNLFNSRFDLVQQSTDRSQVFIDRTDRFWVSIVGTNRFRALHVAILFFSLILISSWPCESFPLVSLLIPIGLELSMMLYGLVH